MALTKPAAEPSAQSPPPSSQQAIASYMGWPEHFMHRIGFYKHPILVGASIVALHYLYYRTCQLVCAADTCYLHILFQVALWYCFLYFMVYRGERREELLLEARLEALRSPTQEPCGDRTEGSS